MFSRWLYLYALHALLAAGQEKLAPEAPKAEVKADLKTETKSDPRTELNLLGKVDTQSGESRRNENVQFNLIDNNTRKELNSRLGTSATIVDEFRPEQISSVSSSEISRRRCYSCPRARAPRCTAAFTKRTTTASSARAPSFRRAA
jgi:hypothetical protein